MTRHCSNNSLHLTAKTRGVFVPSFHSAAGELKRYAEKINKMTYQQHYYSKHKDDSIAFWLEAEIHQLDTHVLWAALLCIRSDKNDEIKSKYFFKDYFCAAEVLHELIKRGIVRCITKKTKKHIIETAWAELEETIDTCKSYLTIPLSTEAEEHDKKYRKPDNCFWFEIVVNSFTNDIVKFSLSLFGYKYMLPNLELNKQVFYLFSDRLDAKIRFEADWFPLDLIIKQLLKLLKNELLLCIKEDLKHELNLLKNPTDIQIQSSCRSIFPLLERVLRNYSEAQGWRGKDHNIDLLINKYDNNKILNKDTIELLRFVSKPMRDYIQHGHTIGISVAKVVLATILESLVLICSELEN